MRPRSRRAMVAPWFALSFEKTYVDKRSLDFFGGG